MTGYTEFPVGSWVAITGTSDRQLFGYAEGALVVGHTFDRRVRVWLGRSELTLEPEWLRRTGDDG